MILVKRDTAQFPTAWTTLAALLLGTPCLAASPAGAADPVTPPGIRYVHERRQDPAVSLHVVTVDLTNPNVAIRVAPGGPDPDGPWQTTLLSVPKIADRDGFELAINGDFFMADQAVDANTAEGLAALAGGGYRTGQRASVVGLAVTDGRQWATPATPKPAIMVTAEGKVETAEVTRVPEGVSQAMSGNVYLVAGGKVGDLRGMDRNARTAVGLDRARTTLTIVVVDGLVDGRASGVTVPELGAEMLRLGCYDAIGLDGGGSSTLVLRETSAQGGNKRYRVMNCPTDGKPRPVASALGISVGDAGRTRDKK